MGLYAFNQGLYINHFPYNSPVKAWFSLLTVINGYSQLLLMNPELPDNIRLKNEDYIRLTSSYLGLVELRVVLSVSWVAINTVYLLKTP